MCISHQYLISPLPPLFFSPSMHTLPPGAVVSESGAVAAATVSDVAAVVAAAAAAAGVANVGAGTAFVLVFYAGVLASCLFRLVVGSILQMPL